MNIFDAERYTISVRKEIVEGDMLYVARVTELQDIEEYADSRAEAYALAIDSIETAHELCLEKGIIFPEPAIHDYSEAQASGRITLRIPKTLHANLVTKAAYESVSLNSFIVHELSASNSQSNLYEKIKTGFDRIEIGLNKVNDGFQNLKERTSHHLFQMAFLPDNLEIRDYTFIQKPVGKISYVR